MALVLSINSCFRNVSDRVLVREYFTYKNYYPMNINNLYEAVPVEEIIQGENGLEPITVINFSPVTRESLEEWLNERLNKAIEHFKNISPGRISLSGTQIAYILEQFLKD